MRRITITGVVLIAIGAFLVTLAPLVRFYAAGRLIAAPADQYGITKLRADNARYFSKGDLKVLTGNLDITVTTRGDVEAAKGDDVVWDEFTAVNDVSNDKEGISYAQRRSAFNKFTGAGVDCCGASVEKEPVKLSGQIYLFPFDTQKRTYPVFNASVRQAYDARFTGEDTINGVQVYKFEQTVPPTKVETLTAPAKVLGMTQTGDVQVDRWYDGTITYWVEPVSGTPVQQEQRRHEVLKTQDGVERSVAFVATAKYTPQSVGELMDKALDAKSRINTLRTTVPVALLAVGLLFIAAGALLAARRPRSGSHAA
ncbi:DUF3068 domain-containing protein [Sphaerisporangium rubeum]|uniref:DUF3068 domain-containing protein n=1 Tax=Sphaerisporangium rubeum TaxID=321317 RepID=A0A7X0ICT6_9ACTN|nr:DUF3068 domain-containing protein [Sphaerisporangium rubeum]MBB6472134.1 hypothetical protein [Sphaerisporangium rubeum]